MCADSLKGRDVKHSGTAFFTNTLALDATYGQNARHELTAYRIAGVEELKPSAQE